MTVQLTSIFQPFQWGSITHKMALPIQGISWCVLFTFFFCEKQNALAFNQDTWCHLALCLQMILLHFEIDRIAIWKVKRGRVFKFSQTGVRTQLFFSIFIYFLLLYTWATAAPLVYVHSLARLKLLLFITDNSNLIRLKHSLDGSVNSSKKLLHWLQLFCKENNALILNFRLSYDNRVRKEECCSYKQLPLKYYYDPNKNILL
jgi:hypothetical protein